MAASSAHDIPVHFVWRADYHAILEQIASTDSVETEWKELRDIIKYKVAENVSDFLSDAPPNVTSSTPSILSDQSTPSGGLKCPPFPPRKRDELNNYEAPISFMNKEQADELKGFIFEQLDQFDDSPPFTIQRICELCVRPKGHYKSVGKYLRAVEKTLFVTSTYAAFPPLPPPTTDPSKPIITILASTSNSVPTTPLFSPIPFLHEDARRSQSRSPPPSPLTLTPAAGLANVEPMETKGLGLVDELDDPKPGHMSDHPTALTVTTTTKTEGSGTVSKPLFGSLDQRFVKASEQEARGTPEDMTIDEAEVDKENQG